MGTGTTRGEEGEEQFSTLALDSTYMGYLGEGELVEVITQIIRGMWEFSTFSCYEGEVVEEQFITLTNISLDSICMGYLGEGEVEDVIRGVWEVSTCRCYEGEVVEEQFSTLINISLDSCYMGYLG